MRDKQFCIVGLGEILWDIFPRGKQLGGAPANFAYCANILGDTGVAASRLGTDQLGNEALHMLEGLGLETSFLQADDVHPTGTVNVRVDAKGEPTFEITNSVAWDFLTWDKAWQSLANQADAVCFGTLAQRSPCSRETISAFLAALSPKAVRVFDVNLRQSFYSAETILQSIQLTHILKLNHEELPRVAQILGFPAAPSEELCAQQIRDKYNLQLVCVTRGARGSFLVGKDAFDQHAGFQVPVVDAVGAGDAFTAALVHHFLRQSSLARMNEAANRMGAWVASQAGATPAPDQPSLERVRRA